MVQPDLSVGDLLLTDNPVHHGAMTTYLHLPFNNFSHVAFKIRRSISSKCTNRFTSTFRIARVRQRTMIYPHMPMSLTRTTHLNRFLSNRTTLLLRPSTFIRSLLNRVHSLLYFSSRNSGCDWLHDRVYMGHRSCMVAGAEGFMVACVGGHQGRGQSIRRRRSRSPQPLPIQPRTQPQLTQLTHLPRRTKGQKK